MKKKWGESRRRIIDFLEAHAGEEVQINRLGEKLGVKQSSIYNTLSDLRRVGVLPNPIRLTLQPVPRDFDRLVALKMLRSVGREKHRKRIDREMRRLEVE